MKQLMLFAALLAAATTFAQDKNIPKAKWHFGRAGGQDTTWGYAQVVKVGNTLYLSGTVATSLDERGITNVYRNIERSLAQYGATMQNVVKETIYTTDMDGLKAVVGFRNKFYKGDFPASTWVQISRLFMPEAKIEVEVIAELPR